MFSGVVSTEVSSTSSFFERFKAGLCRLKSVARGCFGVKVLSVKSIGVKLSLFSGVTFVQILALEKLIDVVTDVVNFGVFCFWYSTNKKR